jgi:rhodanese-related sulfurtransferase
MTKQIDVKTLRDWLETPQPVTGLDIRTDDDRAQWAIPGSLHVNAYEALRKGEPGPLDVLPLAADLKSLNATFMDPIKFANLIAESNVVTF